MGPGAVLINTFTLSVVSRALEKLQRRMAVRDLYAASDAILKISHLPLLRLSSKQLPRTFIAATESREPASGSDIAFGTSHKRTENSATLKNARKKGNYCREFFNCCPTYVERKYMFGPDASLPPNLKTGCGYWPCSESVRMLKKGESFAGSLQAITLRTCSDANVAAGAP